jgi:hypothetical protein
MVLERRILRLNDQIAALQTDEAQAAAELGMLLHLDDDAQRDAAVSDHPLDRADARETSGDVERMRRHVDQLARKRSRLEAKRDRLLGRRAQD